MSRTTANAEQAEYWNADEARHWVAEQEAYDRMLAPYTTRLLEAAALDRGKRVVDIGCGTGSTTCAAARTVTDGDALGLDISLPMVEAARARAERELLGNTLFEVADVQTYAFDGSVRDVAISRFGVMFFDDPVAAFTNIRSGLHAGGRLVFVCWQGLLQNEWMTVPGMAVAQHLPLPEGGPAGAPGPFAFGDPDRVRAVLEGAGFADIEIDAAEESILLGGGGSLEDTTGFLSRTGMARVLFADAPPEAVDQALDSVRSALEPYRTPQGVRLGAACWLVSARA